MRVLVAHGSRRGGTAEIAEQIGAVLSEAGLDVDVRAAGRDLAVDGYDAVIVGGALYVNRWHRDARRFVRANAAALAQRPVWLFSSGPLDDEANRETIPPTRMVGALAERVHARGHATFGGRLRADAQGVLAAAMAKDHAGDWRDPDRIAAWARQIAGELRGAHTTERGALTT